LILETAVERAVGRVPSRGGGEAACPVRRVTGTGLQASVTHQVGRYQMRARSAGALYMGVPSRMSQAL